MAGYTFALPDIGEGLHEAEIVSWLVPEGSRVNENEDFVEVQTDKAVVEISSPVSGTLIRYGAAEGESIRVGETLAVFGETESLHFEESEWEGKGSLDTKGTSIESEYPGNEKRPPQRILAAPSVRKAARVAGVDLTKVKGSGKAGKILMRDLESHPTEADYDSSWTSGERESDHVPYQIEKIRGIRKVTFERMSTAVHTAALCTGMDEVDVTKLVDLRKTLNSMTEQKLTYLPFIVKAAARALRLNPIFNVTIDDSNMTMKKHQDIHIGIATATADGLVVPVIRHADQLTLEQLAAEIKRLSEGARNRSLKPHELSGSTFTVSSTGGNGGFYATPIVNYPEVAILGVHAIKKRPVVSRDQIVIGEVMGMSLTFDHRIIDGEPSGKFMKDVKDMLEQPERFILQSI